MRRIVGLVVVIIVIMIVEMIVTMIVEMIVTMIVLMIMAIIVAMMVVMIVCMIESMIVHGPLILPQQQWPTYSVVEFLIWYMNFFKTQLEEIWGMQTYTKPSQVKFVLSLAQLSPSLFFILITNHYQPSPAITSHRDIVSTCSKDNIIRPFWNILEHS